MKIRWLRITGIGPFAGTHTVDFSAFEEKNAAFLGRGVVFNKFTGSRGKAGSNDANAEYMARIRA